MHSHLAREIIFAIGDNMREGLEPLLTKILAPSLYQVYLHVDDYDRLRGIFGEIEQEAKVYLDGELQSLNQKAAPSLERLRDRLPNLTGRATAEAAASFVQHEPAGGEWHIRFQEDPNDQLEPGEVEVVSELAVGQEAGYASGRKTQRIAVSTTRKLQQSSSQREVVEGEAAGNESPTVPTPPAVSQPPAFLEFSDKKGAQRFSIAKDEIVVGRGAVDVWVDLRLETLPDVSRRHVKIRRDPTSNRFWVEDLSQFGIKINDQAAPKGQEVELIDGARIELADVITLTFRKRV